MSGFQVRARLTQGGFTVDAAFETEGPVVALFGPSGAGKSTLLRVIAGLLKPQAGRIVIGGHVVFDSAARIDLPSRRRRVGLVFQDGLLFPHMSVRQNLFYGAWARGKPPGSALADVIDILGIGALLDRSPRTLSGGERQRVAIGRAVLSDPAVLLMDEPVTAVDQERRAEILPYLETLTRTATVPLLYVSHNPAEVARLGARVVHVKDGRVTGVSETISS